MKWKEPDFKNAIEKTPAMLIYGPDAGQIDEFCDFAIEKLSIEKDNMFALDANELSEKQDALFAESCTPSMFGGRKIVIISGATDGDANEISDLVLNPRLCATVIVCAGDLRSGGALRRLFEDGENIAALACYTDDAKGLANLIRNELSALGITQITSDAMGYMVTHLGADRAITRGFLEKLSLYVGDKKIVELDDAEKCLPDSGVAGLDDFLYSLTAGQTDCVRQTMLMLDRLLYSGAEPSMLVRMLYLHFKKLLTAVVDGQLPRNLFWKVKDKFTVAMNIWRESDIDAVLVRLNELEKQLRTTGMPHEVLLRDFALKLSVRASRFALRKRK